MYRHGYWLYVLLALLSMGAAARTCEPSRQPSAGALLVQASSPGHGSASTRGRRGTASYVLDEDEGRHYLLTAYHLVQGASGIELKGADPIQSLPLKELVQEVAYLPELDLAVYPCQADCQARLADPVQERYPIVMRTRPRNWPGIGSQLSAIGNPRVLVANRRALLPVNSATGATVHSYARLIDITAREAYRTITQPFLILSNFAIRPGFSGGPGSDSNLDIGVQHSSERLSKRLYNPSIDYQIPYCIS